MCGDISFYQFGPLKVSVSSDKNQNIWEIWKWKTDPYRIFETEIPCNLAVSLTASAISWKPDVMLQSAEAGFFRHSVYSAVDGGTLWQYERIKNGEVVLRYIVSPAWDAINLLEDHSDTAGHLAFEYLGQMMPGVLLNHRTLTFHGVLLEYMGQGIILSAYSGIGKTTHARLWRDFKHAFILNGDRAVCRKEQGVWMGIGLPWSGSSGEQMNRSVPLSALVVLGRGTDNQVRLVKKLEAFSAVFPHLQYPIWDRTLMENAMDLFDDFLKQIPVFYLSCRPDEEAVEVLDKALKNVANRDI